MKSFFLSLIAVFVLTVSANAQNYRFDASATTASGSGTLLPVMAIPNASVSIYTCSGTAVSSCNTLANTYNTISASQSCPTYAQVVLQGTATCSSTTDAQGNWGAWFTASPSFGYAYTLTHAGKTYGPYQFTIGGSGGSYLPLTGGTVNGSVNQICQNPSVVGSSTTFVCNYFTQYITANPSVGQSGITQGSQLSIVNMTAPGTNPGTNGAVNSFNETGGGGPDYVLNNYQRGNHSAFSATANGYGGGDLQGANINATGFCNGQRGADEGCEDIRSNIGQFLTYAKGSILTGASTGSIALTTSATFPFSDEGYLLDVSQPTGTALITAQNLPSGGFNSQNQTVSGISMTPSTAWGTMNPATVTYSSSPVGLYQNYTLATAIITVQFGTFSVGAMACSGNNFEYMQITAVGAVSGGLQSVTFNTRNAWDGTQGNTNLAMCMQGSSVIGQAFVATSTINSWPVAYPILGATSPTTMVYANCHFGDCNGHNSLNRLANYTPITLFPYAEIIGTNGGTTGAVQLAYNNVPFAQNDIVASAPTAQVAITGFHMNMQVGTPSIFNLSQDILDAPSVVGYQVNDYGLQPGNMYFQGNNGWFSYNAPTALMAGNGNYQNWLLMSNTPPSGGCMFCANNNNAEGASFTGSVSGSTLIVSAISSGFIQFDQELVGTGITAPCLIGAFTPGSGTPGGVGTYALTNCTGTASSEAMTTVKGLYKVFCVNGANGLCTTYDALTNVATMSPANGAGTVAIPTLSLTNLPNNSTPTLICIVNQVVTTVGCPSSGGGFTINSFTTSATNPVEIGATITNPAFAAIYSTTPTSAAITNTDGTGSPTNLTTPFTSGTVTGSFVHTTATTVTFTLTTVPSATRTLALNWYARVFGGLGTSGTTGATASGTNAVLTGATGTLASAGLVSTSVGQTFGPYAPSAQYIHLLIVGNAHTIFRDPSTSFSIPFNTPTCFTFTNANGSAFNMCDYQSTNALTASAQSVTVVN